MKNVKSKIARILEYEQGVEKTRNYYAKKYRANTKNKDSFEALSTLNAELKGIRNIKEILGI